MDRKKVLFVYTSEIATGLTNKAKKIESGFAESGCDVDTIYLGPGSSSPGRIRNILSVYGQFITQSTLVRYDVIYARYAYYFLPLYFLSLLQRANLQVEVNTNTTDELLGRGQRVRALVDQISMAVVRRAAKKIHIVSKTLTENLKSKYPKANFIFTPNFVVDDESPPKRDGVRSEKINLVFMGNTVQKWHGIEIFIDEFLAKNDWFKSACQLHFIGQVDIDTKEAIARNGLQANVTFHGVLEGDAKHTALSKMDIGLSSFDLKFKNMTETTAIKTAEYLYNGIGLIAGYEDPVIPSSLEFVLNIDFANNSDDERRKFNSFIASYRNIPLVQEQAHQWAKNHLLVSHYIDNILNDIVRN